MVLHNCISFNPKRTDDTLELETALIKHFRETTCLGRMKIAQAVMNICDEIDEEQKIQAALNHGKIVNIVR